MASQELELLQADANAEPSQESQGIEIPNVQKKLQEHKMRLKQRRKERDAKIAVAHQKRVDKLKADYERAKTRHTEAIRAIQRPKVEHLLDLIRRKRVLVTELDGCHTRQQIAFSATVDKVQLAIDARLAALSE